MSYLENPENLWHQCTHVLEKKKQEPGGERGKGAPMFIFYKPLNGASSVVEQFGALSIVVEL